MAIVNVVLVGANGKLGPFILTALLSANIFSVTVLSRSSSTSKYPMSVYEMRISDDPSVEELVKVLKGQDAFIAAFAGSNDHLQIRYANAAAQAGVKRFIPADFGSCDSSSPKALELIPLYGKKKKVRECLQHLASTSDLTWTSLVNGHFFDYGLKSGLLGFNLKNRKALIFDDGNVKWSATTLERIGQAVVRILQKAEDTKNRMLYVESVCVSQMELLTVLEKLEGRKWQAEHVASDEYMKRTQAKLDKSPGDADEMEDMVSVVGIIDGNWEGKEGFANHLLDLKREDLEWLVKNILDTV